MFITDTIRSFKICSVLGIRLSDIEADDYQELEIISLIHNVIRKNCYEWYINNPFISVAIDAVYRNASVDSIEDALFLYIAACYNNTDSDWSRLTDYGFNIFNGVDIRNFTSPYDAIVTPRLHDKKIKCFISFCLSTAFGVLIDDNPIVSISTKMEKLTQNDFDKLRVVACNMVCKSEDVLRVMRGEKIDYTDCIPTREKAEVEIHFVGEDN